MQREVVKSGGGTSEMCTSSMCVISTKNGYGAVAQPPHACSTGTSVRKAKRLFQCAEANLEGLYPVLIASNILQRSKTGLLSTKRGWGLAAELRKGDRRVR